jgi:hypothetical protein
MGIFSSTIKYQVSPSQMTLGAFVQSILLLDSPPRLLELEAAVGDAVGRTKRVKWA